ncbi:MAG: 2'-5' RNA ligase family protein [Lachnospiraceae bacterium]|nr:2'-5' RNA ligase family protein [Lachnospiraceae bacterium]
MAEQFITLMADLDADTQEQMSQWYEILKEAGFTGVQTPGLPFHISLTTFPLDKEAEAVKMLTKAAVDFAPIPVVLSHVGMFPGGRVLFAGPERGDGLSALHEACQSDSPQEFPWTPHVTILIDEPERVQAALPILMKSFRTIEARITRLHLCAFWPTREIAAAQLEGER